MKYRVNRVVFGQGWTYRQSDEGFPLVPEVEYVCMAADDFEAYRKYLIEEARTRWDDPCCDVAQDLRDAANKEGARQ